MNNAMKSRALGRMVLIQDSMLGQAPSYFETEEVEYLRALIRITGDFYDYLQLVNLTSPDQSDLEYIIGSVISGMDSFRNVNGAYRILKGATSSQIKWGPLSLAALKDQFLTMFDEFASESEFTQRCRRLLDLFKIQLVFAGAFFD
jgi:hypothetical protein